MVAINTNRKQKLVKGLTAGAAVLGVGAIASFSAWTASQTFTTEANIADSPENALEYSTNGGLSWDAFDGGTIEIAFGTFERTNMLPGAQDDISISVRNTSEQTTFFESTTAPHTAVASGNMFEGETPVTLTVADEGMEVLTPGQESGGIYTITVPENLEESYSGATGEVTIELNYDITNG